MIKLTRSLIRYSVQKRQVIFTGVQPTGNLHLGNYLGSIQNVIKLQTDSNQLLLCLVDLHALTNRFQQDHSNIQFKSTLNSDTYEMAETMLACGVDPDKTILYAQSHVSQHTQLCWILSCILPQNWLNTMIQYKQKGGLSSSLGLYSYPVLMAADILLFKTNRVPVGLDQLQHLQLAQRIADRFNSYFPETFIRPQYVKATVPKVMSLVNGSKKMSKSQGPDKSRIHLTDSPQTAAFKIMKAKTDNIQKIYADQTRPEVTNLLSIYSALNNTTMQQSENKLKQKTMLDFKKQLGDMLAKQLAIIQNNLLNIRKNPQYVNETLKKGAQRAKYIAKKNLKQIKNRLGLLQI